VWLKGATRHTGSWWTDWTTWLIERSGDERDAPTILGSERHPPSDPAPGRYVFN
jgi:polyhydroxyalkanoate synthase